MKLLGFGLAFLSFFVQAEFAEVSVGKLERVEQFKSELVPDRTVEIWLPDGYSAENDYAVVYMHDGQMLFDESKTWNGQEWHVDETAQKLIDEGAVAPFIVVGIFNGDAHRHNEYFPQKPFENLPKTLQEKLYEQSRDAEHGLFARSVNSDSYLKFIVNEVRPYIESTYSVDSKRSYLMGSSMGGLISWYGLLEYPEVFAGAACLSTHWPGDFTAKNNPIPAYFTDYLAKNLGKLSSQKLYFDYGDQTLDALYPPLQEKVDVVLSEKYGGDNTLVKFFPGTNHSENAWAERLSVPLVFLLGEKQLGEKQ